MLDTTFSPASQTKIRKPQLNYDMVPAGEFTIKQLTDVYNQTRMDYVVPMPMSETKLKEYIHNYDVDLNHSLVAVSKGHPFGLALLGIRGHKTWVTRLGITPDGRKKGVGRAMMTGLLNNSRRLGARTVILEVIKKNTPARYLFGSFGFETLRELLVIRRPPVPLAEPMNDKLHIKTVGPLEAMALLNKRADEASWVTANESMRNVENLSALVAHLPDGKQAWLVYQNTPFQLSRLVLETGKNTALATTLLQHLHTIHPLQDTVVENLAANDRSWPAFQALGYLISFTRIEMELGLATWALNKAGINLPISQALPV